MKTYVSAGFTLAWRPKLLVAIVAGAIGAVADDTYAELVMPDLAFARALVLVTGLEFVWRLGRAGYEAYIDAQDDLVTAVGTTLMEAALLYTGYLTVLAVTTILARSVEGTPIADYAHGLHLAIYAAVILTQLTHIVLHWKGSPDAARRFFGRLGRAWKAVKTKDPGALSEKPQS